MKGSVFGLIFIFAMAGFSQQPIVPITGFGSVHYKVSGAWLADDGTSGDYLSFIDFENTGWITAQFRLGNLYIYENCLNFDANGFFTAKVTDATDPTNPIVYIGNGNCGTTQCQLNVPLGNGTLQKSIIFNSTTNTLYSFGAIYFDDGTPDIQWEESGDLLP